MVCKEMTEEQTTESLETERALSLLTREMTEAKDLKETTETIEMTETKDQQEQLLEEMIQLLK